MDLANKSKLTFFRIPKDELTLREMATKYRELRLQGLQLSPEAFSSTFEVESSYPISIWEDRLRKPELETFICATPAVSVKDSLVGIGADAESSQWIAQVTLRGPLDEQDNFINTLQTFHEKYNKAAISDSIDEVDNHHHEKWQIMSLYMLPTYRGQGIAIKICKYALSFLKDTRLKISVLETKIEQPETPCEITVRTMIKSTNDASVKLFRKLDFEEIGRCTLAEALRANGEAVPADSGEAMTVLRSGYVLALKMKRRSS